MKLGLYVTLMRFLNNLVLSSSLSVSYLEHSAYLEQTLIIGESLMNFRKIKHDVLLLCKLYIIQ